ncbi:MAG TPA: hypothetical protein VNY05_36660 [Candidatus Acidoferrales bacterium]|jgi:hypothetical protein|nr:hypothetical protein [Candidatus Acidoferrales bacterium]
MDALTLRNWLRSTPLRCWLPRPPWEHEGELTSRQVMERIRKNAGVTWRSQTVDTFKAGNPDTPVM